MKRQSILVLAIVAILTANATTFADLETGLVANYPFNGNANDVSGNGHHGTISGATLTSDRFGNSDSAYSFNGVSDYISVPYSIDFQLPVFTFAAWVNPTADLSSLVSSAIVCRGEDSITDLAAFSLFVIGEANPYGNGAMVLYEIDSSNKDYLYDTSYYPQVETWTHLAATRLSNGQLNIYSNGNLLGYWESTPAPTPDCFQDLTIGAYWSSNGISELKAYFPGAIDDVRIYNRALSDDEINDLYVVPVPSTVLLGTIGLSFAGLKLRKRILQ